MVNDLRSFPMLAEMDSKDLEILSGLMKQENFPAGSRIIEEGDMGDTMYLLVDGTVDVLKTTLYGDEYVCATLKDEYSCVFGEIAMIDHDRRSATVKAKTDCRTFSITAENFRRYCQDYPAVGCRLLLFIAANLCRNLRQESENLLKVYQALIDEIENTE